MNNYNKPTTSGCCNVDTDAGDGGETIKYTRFDSQLTSDNFVY